jgi:tetratricopeptide (TPR) repeat protein
VDHSVRQNVGFALDQFSAHLDRGWDLAQKGDAPGATACARRALEIDPKSPEVHNLLGYTAALAGDADVALEHYRQAIALDETYFEAMLNAAEVLMHPLGEWDDAIAMCDEALDYAETPEEIADCVLLKVDAFLGKGATEEAGKAMALIPDGPFESPNYMFLIGRAYYETGQLEKAAPLIEEAAKKDPQNGDALYYLGLVRDERGDTRGATEAFLRARAVDLTKPPPAWAPSTDAFATLMEGVVGKLDAILARYVSEADVYVVDVPGAELVVDGVDPRALMILDAPSPGEAREAREITSGLGVRESRETDRGSGGRIFVYQRNVERAAGTLDAMEEELIHALEREITSMFLEKDPTEVIDKHQLN